MNINIQPIGGHENPLSSIRYSKGTHSVLQGIPESHLHGICAYLFLEGARLLSKSQEKGSWCLTFEAPDELVTTLASAYPPLERD